MYGFQVPRNHDQAMDLDAKNGNNKWCESEEIEISQIFEYEAFENKGRGYTPMLTTRRFVATWSIVSSMTVAISHALSPADI